VKQLAIAAAVYQIVATGKVSEMIDKKIAVDTYQREA